MEKERKILCPMDWFFLVVACAIIGYIVMKNYNVSIFEKTESVEIIDKPHSNHKHVKTLDQD